MFADRRPDARIVADILTLGHQEPKAIVILGQVHRILGTEALDLFRQMREMNIFGTKIQIAYERACGSDAQELIRRIRANDPKLIDSINRHIGFDPPAKLRPST